MTSELEKQFFDTLGIKAKEYKVCDNLSCGNPCAKCENCWNYKIYKIEYPEITDRILLELICIINRIDLYFYGEHDYFMTVNYKDLKEEVIAKSKRLVDKNAISEFTGEYIKQQVQALFKE